LLGLVQKTIAPETKLLPLTVSVKAEPPAVALEGEIEEMEGVELAGGGLSTGPLIPPPQADKPARLMKYAQQNKRRKFI
jgi:hypothetical protein